MKVREDKLSTERELEQSNSSQFLRFCWMRETTPGHLEHDGGVRIATCDLLLALLGLHPAQQRATAEPPVSLHEILAGLSGATTYEDLPQWARRRLAIILGPLATPEMRTLAAANLSVLERLAARILAALPPARENEVEVHLPYIDRRDWSNRFKILDATNFVIDQRRIVPEALLDPERMAAYNTQLLAVASASPGFEVAHSFAVERPVPPELFAGLLPVGAVPPEAPAPRRAGIRMQLDGAACRAWNVAPLEKSGAYFKAHSRVSMTVQSALRRWVAWYWFSDIRQCADTPNSFTALAYLCAQPFAGRRRTDFTFDVLTNEWMDYAFRCSRRPLKIVLKSVRQALLAVGETELARTYHPDRAGNILKRVRKERKSIRAVVAAEGAIVNHILKFGLELQHAEPIVAARASADFAKGLRSRLRRLSREEDLAFLGQMLLLEATNALHLALGGESALSVSVTTHPDPAADAAWTRSLPTPLESHPEPLPC
jgi:hypothetical protein